LADLKRSKRRADERENNRLYKFCQLEGCSNSLEGKRWNAKYCCREHNKQAWVDRQKHQHIYEVCQYEGCNRSLLNQQTNSKFCKKHGRSNPYYKKSKRQYATCQLEGCDNPIDDRTWHSRYCCDEHRMRRFYQSKKGKLLSRKHHQIRRAQKYAVPTTYTDADWQKCLEYFENKCAYCGRPFTVDTPHQDHFIPLSKGGPYTPDNIVPACPTCNLSKNNLNPDEWCSIEQYIKIENYFQDIIR